MNAPVLISAHRGGAGHDVGLENTRAALERALALGVDLVEVDVRRLGDGTFVLFHDPDVDVDGVPRSLMDLTWAEFAALGRHGLRFDDVLTWLGPDVGLHLDPKLDRPDAALEVTRMAHAALGDDRVVVTLGGDEHVRAVRDWVEESGAGVLVALSVGTGLGGPRPWREKLATLRAEMFCEARLRDLGVTALAANHGLAFLRLRRVARRLGLPLLVWTVDPTWELTWWLRPGRAWAVTTNHPDRALDVVSRGAVRTRSRRGTGRTGARG